MKLLRVGLQNVRSFLNRENLVLDGPLSIIVGPNGGGKTNLLDTIVWAIRRFVLQSWSRRQSSTPEYPFREEFVLNDIFNDQALERHFSGAGKDQIVELTFEVTEQDRANMDEMAATSAQTQPYWKDQSKRTSPVVPDPSQWLLGRLPAIGTEVLFTIRNGALQPISEAARSFRDYLAWYELDATARSELGMRPLGYPMLSLPVRRSASGFNSSIALPHFNEHDLKRAVDAANSRYDANLASLATGRLAAKYRSLLSSCPGDHERQFYNDDNVAALTRALNELGYTWRLTETNAQKNEYDIRLTKQGSSFLAGNASSGEKELLTYLFAIYALNVRDALIVIDEPELHLHPRWQFTLLNLFERLAKSTGNQFLMATHSPAFISPASVQYVSRVYSDQQASKIVRLDSQSLPDRKHLFSIVNSFNNERIFFTDKVILVEGISDRIFFEALLKHFRLKEVLGQAYEVVSVGGKFLFKKYQQLLEASKVRWKLVADRDYASDIGTSEIKQLFTADASSIKVDIIENPKSLDGEALVSALDDAINVGDRVALDELWTYIKSRRLKLIDDLTADESGRLSKFIDAQQANGVFILAAGALEAYLPIGHGRKDLERLIELTTADDFWERLPNPGKSELTKIAHELLKD